MSLQSCLPSWVVTACKLCKAATKIYQHLYKWVVSPQEILLCCSCVHGTTGVEREPLEEIFWKTHRRPCLLENPATQVCLHLTLATGKEQSVWHFQPHLCFPCCEIMGKWCHTPQGNSSLLLHFLWFLFLLK